MRPLPLRLAPGDDVRRALEDAVARAGCTAAFVVSGIGSLSCAELRLAGHAEATPLQGDLEILTLAGTIAGAASHVHASVADAAGAVLGGHLGYGSVVRTTCEVLLALLDEWAFSREPDTTTGCLELVVHRR